MYICMKDGEVMNLRTLVLLFISITMSLVKAQQVSKEKPRPFTQIKVNDFFTLDNIEFVCITTLQYGEVIIGDTMDVYTPSKGFMGRCRIIEIENPYTEEKLTIRHAPSSLKITTKAINSIIDEHSYLVSRGKLPYGVRLSNTLTKVQKDTLKTQKDSVRKSP